jgi:hypothetical protein
MDKQIEDIIKSYFEGGNARDIKFGANIKEIMIAIAEAVEEIEKK